MRPFVTALAVLCFCLPFVACKAEKETAPPAVPGGAPPATEQGKVAPARPSEPPPPPPGVPVTETFDKDPQINLFARVASYRPADDDTKGLGFWSTYIDHIQRTSGMRPKSGRNGSNGWVIQGIKGLDSVSFFAPLAVKPTTRYQVTFDFKGDLPKGASAGVGVLEFREFLWIGEQFTEALSKEYQTGTWPGVAIKTTSDWKSYAFDFTTSPGAGMIHLVLFRDGVMDRDKPVIFDNIAVKEVVR